MSIATNIIEDENTINSGNIFASEAYPKTTGADEPKVTIHDRNRPRPPPCTAAGNRLTRYVFFSERSALTAPNGTMTNKIVMKLLEIDNKSKDIQHASEIAISTSSGLYLSDRFPPTI